MSEWLKTLEAAAIVLGGAILFIQNHRQTKHSRDVKQSITENNGGSSVKDRLDSIDKQYKSMDQRLGRIEGALINKGVGRKDVD